MAVKAAGGGLSVTFYPPGERASQTLRNFRRWKTKMRKRKHKFSTIYGSGTDAKCRPDRMSCAGLKRTAGNSKRNVSQCADPYSLQRSIISDTAGLLLRSMGSLSYSSDVPTITDACAHCTLLLPAQALRVVRNSTSLSLRHQFSFCEESSKTRGRGGF